MIDPSLGRRTDRGNGGGDDVSLGMAAGTPPLRGSPGLEAATDPVYISDRDGE